MPDTTEKDTTEKEQPTVIVIREDIKVDEKELRRYGLPFSNVIPAGYFLYLRNIGYSDINVDSIDINSSVAGVVDAYLAIDYVMGDEITAINSKDIKSVNKRVGSPYKAAVECYTAAIFQDMQPIGQLDRFDIDKKYKTYNVKLDLTLPPERAIAIRWGANIGVLSGTINISEQL